MTAKAALRRELKARRASLPDREKRDAALLERLLSLEEYRAAAQLLTYVSVGEEADTRRLMEAAWADRKEVFAPVCRPGGQLTFHRAAGWEDLRPAPFGLLEPDPDRCPAWQPNGPALCVAPGLAFDRRGRRLGYGKGYYDRFLAVFTGAAVGLCYGALLLDSIPAEAHDRPVDRIVTEDGVLDAIKEEQPHE